MRFPADPAHVWITPLAVVFLLYVGAFLPWAALRQHRRMAGVPTTALPSRIRLYVSGLITHGTFLLLAWAVCRTTDLDLLAPYRLTPTHALVGVVALAVGLALLSPRLQIDNPVGREHAKLLAPRTAGEHGVFYLVCVSAGIAEELTYRGLFFVLLAKMLGGWWLPALATSAIFGVVHLFQGWKSAGLAGLMGLREHIVVGLTGSLFVAMVVHMLHDIVTGTVISWRVRRAETLNAVS